MNAVRCNINASSYDGDVSFIFDCVRDGRCKFGLYESMPPESHMECTFYRNGTCMQQAARIAALKELNSNIKAEIKRIESEDTGEA
jgi:hypothetical protein